MCEVDESLKEKLKKFRFRKETNNAAILSEYHIIIMNVVVICVYCVSNQNNLFHFLVKIDMEKQLVILQEEYEASQICFLLLLLILH